MKFSLEGLNGTVNTKKIWVLRVLTVILLWNHKTNSLRHPKNKSTVRVTSIQKEKKAKNEKSLKKCCFMSVNNVNTYFHIFFWSISFVFQFISVLILTVTFLDIWEKMSHTLKPFYFLHDSKFHTFHGKQLEPEKN